MTSTHLTLFWFSFFLSLLAALGAGILGTLLGYLLSTLKVRSQLLLRGLFLAFFVMPSYLHAVGWLYLTRPETSLFRVVPGISADLLGLLPAYGPKTLI